MLTPLRWVPFARADIAFCMSLESLKTFGGGIGFLFKESLAVNTNVCETFKSFELMDISLKGAKAVRILCVYRPPD